MPLTCQLLLLFVLKLENLLSQELNMLYRVWAQKISEYLLFFGVFFRWNPPPPSPSLSPPHPQKKSSDLDSFSKFTY